MKRLVTLFLLVSFSGLVGLRAQAPCDIELGTNDFPYTDGNQTIELSTTGSVGTLSSNYFGCGLEIKTGSMWPGQNSNPGTLTNTFSIPVNKAIYRYGGANAGEQLTISTTPPGTVSISYVDGGCPETVSVAGNVVSFVGSTSGGALQIESTAAFSSITLSHNGSGNGLVLNMCYDPSFLDEPVAVPLSWWPLVLGGLLIGAVVIWRFR